MTDGFTSNSVYPCHLDVGWRNRDWLRRLRSRVGIACAAGDRVSPGADLRRYGSAFVRDGVWPPGERRLVRDGILRRFRGDRVVDCILFAAWAMSQLDRRIVAEQH